MTWTPQFFLSSSSIVLESKSFEIAHEVMELYVFCAFLRNKLRNFLLITVRQIPMTGQEVSEINSDHSSAISFSSMSWNPNQRNFACTTKRFELLLTRVDQFGSRLDCRIHVNISLAPSFLKPAESQRLLPEELTVFGNLRKSINWLIQRKTSAPTSDSISRWYVAYALLGQLVGRGLLRRAYLATLRQRLANFLCVS